MDSEGVEVGEEVLQIGGVGIGRCRHQIVAVEDGRGDAVVVSGSAAGQVGLFVEAEQGGAMQWIGLAVVMALCAV
jgi:hypothetical protein